MKLKNKVLLLSFLWIFYACGNDESTPTPIPEEPLSSPLLDQLLSLGEQNSINRSTIDWTATRTSVYQSFEEDGLNEAILTFLRALGDNHSFYRASSNGISLFTGASCALNQAFSFDNLPSEIGYVYVPNTSGGSVTTFAQNIHDEIRRQNTTDKKGWIVDLSENPGGNMYPMLAGLSPLLDEGTLGNFVDPDGGVSPWTQEEGAIAVSGTPVITMPDDFELENPDVKIAVVSSPLTASSGEATLISFIGANNTRTFGEPTCGLSTANQGFNLLDGGTLFLTVATMADRNQNLFGGRITPDVEISDNTALNQAIIDWIMEE